MMTQDAAKNREQIQFLAWLADLKGRPLIVYRASITGTVMLFGLHVAATCNLLDNASLMVEDGLGYTLFFDRLIHTGEGKPLAFRPGEKTIDVAGMLIWRKYQLNLPETYSLPVLPDRYRLRYCQAPSFPMSAEGDEGPCVAGCPQALTAAKMKMYRTRRRTVFFIIIPQF